MNIDSYLVEETIGISCKLVKDMMIEEVATFHRASPTVDEWLDDLHRIIPIELSLIYIAFWIYLCYGFCGVSYVRSTATRLAKLIELNRPFIRRLTEFIKGWSMSVL